MKVTQIKTGLQELKRNFQNILDDSAYVIDRAIAELESTKEKFDEWQRKTHAPGKGPQFWGYEIHPEKPLCFKLSTAIEGLNIWVDLYCKAVWQKEEDMPITQEICLRIWSDSIDFIFRHDIDSEEIFNKLADSILPKRVMLRFHFDLADEGQPGPKYHLQFGGNARPGELCWFPEALKLPRLAFPPMDLILVCQLIAANLYWEEYSQFRETPEWLNALRNSQEHLLKNYYEDCLDAIEQGNSLLDNLWNPLTL